MKIPPILFLVVCLGCVGTVPISPGPKIDDAKARWTEYVASGHAAPFEIQEVEAAIVRYEVFQDEEAALSLIGLINRLTVLPVP